MMTYPTTLTKLLDDATTAHPHALAIVDGGNSLTFAELKADALERAQFLRLLQPNIERVAIIAENSAAMVGQIYGVALAGATTVMINARLQPMEQRILLERSKATCWIGDAPLLEELKTHKTLPTGVVVADLQSAKAPVEGSFEPAPVDAHDPAWLLYTSGTTGVPKGVLLSHGNLLAGAANAGAARQLEEDEVLGLPFPLFHIAATNLLMCHLVHRPVILIAGFEPEEVSRLIELHKITSLSLAPTMVRRLVDFQTRSPTDLSSLRTIYYGAAPITPSLLREANEALKCSFSQGYGMTEASGNAVFLDAVAHRRGLEGDVDLLTQAGSPGPLTTLRIVNDAGQEVPSGVIGEVTLAGPQITAGYDPEEAVPEAEFCLGGGFRTGDLGVLDENGILRIVDRKKDIIITGGENVSSVEVEQALCELPEVRTAAVVARPDPHWGEAIVAVVVPTKEPFDERHVRQVLRTRLARFKQPKHYVVIDELLTNATGKIDKVALRALVLNASSPENAHEPPGSTEK